MKDYRVKWEIDIVAKNPEEAAREALKVMQDPGSTATYFEIYEGDKEPVIIDLMKIDQ